MKTARLLRMVAANTVRSRRHFVLSVFGIVIGIAAFVFFLSLSQGVRAVLLGEVFPLDRVEVIAPQASLLGKDVTKKLDDTTVADIKTYPGVVEAVPRMAVGFPAFGEGFIKRGSKDDGYQRLAFEVGGFCDGIQPDAVRDEVNSEQFRYWDDEPDKKSCTVVDEKKTCDDVMYYCDSRDDLCHHRVPVYISQYLIEIYNAQFASTHGLPKIGELMKWMAGRGGLAKMRFYITLGESMFGASKKSAEEGSRRKVEAVMLGVSDRAMPIGITIPIQYVREWNKEFGDPDAAATYSSIVVKLDSKDQVAPFAGWLRQEPRNLRTEDRLGEQFATAIMIVTAILLLISVVIVVISAINIAHNFFMQISERRREIGVLRAIGATRADVRKLILGEAALIGLSGGALGVAMAWGISLIVDWRAGRAEDFPFKPDTYFHFEPWIIGLALGFSVVFCVLGGLLPALRAAKMPPAQALAER